MLEIRYGVDTQLYVIMEFESEKLDREITVARDRAAEAVRAILDFATAAGRFRYSREEMARARRRFRYGMEFMRDAPSDLAGWYGRATLFGGLFTRIDGRNAPGSSFASKL